MAASMAPESAALPHIQAGDIHQPRQLRKLKREQYKISWVCSRAIERAAAIAMLDEMHEDFENPRGDTNVYTLGSIGEHNVVITSPPKGHYDIFSAGMVAKQLTNSFPLVEFGLIVGIGSGISPKVRLCDVVISAPRDQFPGVIQLDMGSELRQTGTLNNPPTALLEALTSMEVEHEMSESRAFEYLDQLQQKCPEMKDFLRSDSMEDILFNDNYEHVNAIESDNSREKYTGHEQSDTDDDIDEDKDCAYCDKREVVKRMPQGTKIHYGLIASGNKAIADPALRNRLTQEISKDILCVEKNAAAVIRHLPCLVIRGIGDYADSHKNKTWQKCATAMAAAVAKEVMSHLQQSEPSEIEEVKQVKNESLQAMKTDSTQNDQSLQDHELEIRKEILQWLSSSDHSVSQNDYIMRREPGTSEWLLNGPEFDEWLQNPNKTLYCPGIPGAGKSIQVAVVIKELCDRFSKDPAIGIAYLYQNHKQQHNQTPMELFSNLLKQLSSRQSNISSSLVDLYERHDERGTRPLLEEITGVIASVIKGYERVFIIVDALDECQDLEGSRTRFIKNLLSLQRKTGLNIFATSRDIPDITRMFEGYLSVEIQPSNEDVRRYLEQHMFFLPEFVQSDPELQTEIKKVVEKEIGGVFLLANLYLESLVGKRSPGQLKKALENIKDVSRASNNKADALFEIYEKAMEGIQSQRGDLPKDAMLTLSWVVNAQAPLKLTELQHALAVEMSQSQLDEDNIPSAHHIMQSCAPLLVVDIEKNTVGLVHYTAQEYFDQTREKWFPNAHSEIATICATYLSFDQFGDGPCGEFPTRLRCNPLYEYAASNWGHHARLAGNSSPAVLNFLHKPMHIESSAQVLWRQKAMFGSDNGPNSPRDLTGLHLAAYFGVQDAVEYMLKDSDVNVDPRDNYCGRTPLSFAAEHGHDDVVKMLLKLDAVHVNSTDVDIKTPLLRAISNGHDGVVEALLQTGKIRFNQEDGTRRTPIARAASKGYERMVRLLLKQDGIDLNLPSKIKGHYYAEPGRTPLQSAAEFGHTSIVKLLLETNSVGPQLNSSLWGMTPLVLASKNGHTGVVKVLLDLGKVDVNFKRDCHDWPAISWAAEGGHTGVVKLLLDTREADVNMDDVAYNERPLALAATKGHQDVVDLLLEYGKCALHSEGDTFGQTQLQKAIQMGSERAVRVLLKNVPLNIDAKDASGQTRLSIAAENGHYGVVKILLEKWKADLDQLSDNEMAGEAKPATRNTKKSQDGSESENEEGKKISPSKLSETELEIVSGTRSSSSDLIFACRNGYLTDAKLILVVCNIYPDVYDESGRTPLSWAAENGHNSIINMLLGTGKASVNSQDMNGRTPLIWATIGGRLETVKSLLSIGNVDGNKKDNQGRSAILWATILGYESVVRVLLESDEINVDSKDVTGRTPLSWVAQKNDIEIARLLLETEKVDIDLEDDYGDTPLSHAAQSGSEAVIELLLTVAND